MLKMNQMQNYSYDETRCGYGDSHDSISDRILDGYDIAAFELLQARQEKVLSNAGIGSRGFTWSDDFSNSHASNFAGMNTSSVISSWSGGRPSKDFSTVMGDDRGAVPSFDTFDVVPTNGVFLDGVRNGYALVEDRDLGFVNHEIDNAGNEGRPDEGHNTAGKTAAKPILNIKTSNQNQNNSGADGARFGSEDFGVTHDAIFSDLGQLRGKNV